MKYHKASRRITLFGRWKMYHKSHWCRQTEQHAHISHRINSIELCCNLIQILIYNCYFLLWLSSQLNVGWLAASLPCFTINGHFTRKLLVLFRRNYPHIERHKESKELCRCRKNDIILTNRTFHIRIWSKNVDAIMETSTLMRSKKRHTLLMKTYTPWPKLRISSNRIQEKWEKKRRFFLFFRYSLHVFHHTFYTLWYICGGRAHRFRAIFAMDIFNSL